MKAKELVTAYYSAFNRRDAEGLVSLLSDDVIHDINQGKREIGKSAFRDFLAIMSTHYDETVSELTVMVSDDDQRAAAEFLSSGTYKKAERGLPPASGQPYKIQVGAFFEMRNGKISRITNHYNIPEWIVQVTR
jgi:steroid delta-isomerase-like uncharacterized protein